MDTTKLKDNITRQLREKIGIIQDGRIEPFFEAEIKKIHSLTKNQLQELLTIDKKTTYPSIYTLQVKNPRQSRELVTAYKTFHAANRKTQRGQDRINTPRFNDNDSQTLYVGSSMSLFRKRIMEHFGFGNNRTYSLHLTKWAKEGNCTITINVYQVNSKNGGKIPKDVIEIIEQGIWDIHKPIFGKRSGH